MQGFMTGTGRKRVLVDGNSLVYRSFFAIPRLTNREGLPTNAAYGFTTVLRKILTEERPGRAAVVFDTGGVTFRHEVFREYKAQRPAMPDDLAAQLPYAREVAQALGFELIAVPGVEADDVIGTLARRAEKAGDDVLIVSSDKDFFQLVSDRVLVLRPGKDVRYDQGTVASEFGVAPDKVVDVLALAGDTVDNVPGVPGIGEKGAVALIKEWGSLEACLENVGKIPNKRHREGLGQHADDARLSKRLVTLNTEVPLPADAGEHPYVGPDRARAFQLFEKLGFTTLLKDYLPEAAVEAPPSIERLERPAAISAFLARARTAGKVAVFLDANASGFGLALSPAEGVYSASVAELADGLRAPTVLKLGHDLKSVRVRLRRLLGLSLEGLGFDTMVASYVLNPGKRSHDLEALALEILQKRLGTGEPLPGEQALLPGMTGPLGDAGDGPRSTESAERATAIFRLAEKLAPRLEEEGVAALYRDVELPLIPVLADMEVAGIKLDVQTLRGMSTEMATELDALTKDIYALAGTEFNINSPKQLGEILFEKMNLPSFKKTQKQRTASTRVEVLEELAVHFELPKKVLDYRSLSKLKGTYVDALPLLVDPRTGRVHTTFNQTVAATGRLSSSDPNLQNIPIRTELGRRIRKAFVAEEGALLLSADYSQIELRVLAHLSGDKALIEAFRAGEDIHRTTAARVFGEGSGVSDAEQRRRAKIINFSIIYGKTAFTLGKEFGVPTRQAQAFIDSYFERYPKVRELLDEIIKEGRRTGKVKTLFGRHRYVPELGSRNRATREAAERVAVNSPIQGTAADLIKKAMVDLECELRGRQLESRLLLQVHDELVLEVPEREADDVSKLVREVMENVHPMEVPLKVDVAMGKSWIH